MLLHGVTGSGKTAVYLAAMRGVLEAGRSAILLVPEIGLTPAVAADLHQIFGDEVAILHSALSDKERAEQWHRIKRGDARMVVGTRSAVFAPVADLALIIVDEEHDSSYKQEETPRYHARDVAVMRAKMANAVVVLGSATPSLESYFNAKKNKYALRRIARSRRAAPAARSRNHRHAPGVPGDRPRAGHLAQTRRRNQRPARAQRTGHGAAQPPRIFPGRSLPHLRQKARMPELRHRAHPSQARAQNGLPLLRLHRARAESLRALRQRVRLFSRHRIRKTGRILHGMFPQARIARLDRDTVRSHEDFERALNALNEGELDLLVGTQMIAKGHDIHGVTLVGVVGADVALGLPDFRAAERTFQLLTQVAGRAGRGQTPGKVVLQTYFQDHYAVQYAARHDFIGFYEKELQFRSWMHYPPYSALANVLIRSDKLDDALQWSGTLGKWFDSTRHEGVRVLGPAAAPIMRLKRDYRYHFVLKSPSRKKLNTTLARDAGLRRADKKIPRTQVIVDVDALWLM